MYIAKKEGIGGFDYFQTNENDSPRWTKLKDKAKRFETKEEALTQSNLSMLYDIVLEETE